MSTPLPILSLLETRVSSACWSEKQRTVPDSYPLTLNSPCCPAATRKRAATRYWN
jgi:uncharacterized protein YceH (UPF0502 family)